MELSEAIKVLQSALKEDKEYRRTWVANIAMAFQDEFRRSHRMDGVHKISNDAAEYFLQNLCRERNEAGEQ